MPGFDGTGPNGAGPMTGGRFGACAGARRFETHDHSCGRRLYRRMRNQNAEAKDYTERGTDTTQVIEVLKQRSRELEEKLEALSLEVEKLKGQQTE